MQKDWKTIDFPLVQYRDTDLNILSSVDEIQLLLDDHVVKTHTMKGSPFILPFKNEIQRWEDTLVNTMLFNVRNKLEIHLKCNYNFDRI